MLRRGAVLIIALVATSLPAVAVELHWTPADTVVAPGDTLSLTIVLDEAIEIRTVEAWVNYDPTLITNLGGEITGLYVGVPCFVWHDMEEDIPGDFHAFAVTIGSECWVTGPGRLYQWNFIAAEAGTCSIDCSEALLYAPDASLLENVSLAPTTVIIHDPNSDVDTPPALDTGLRLQPNPFNPRVVVACESRVPGACSLDILDFRGRRVITMDHAWRSAGTIEFCWDGRDISGREMPSGVYTFQMRLPDGSVSTIGGTLVR